jgi:outer membrane usher protein
LSDSEVSVGSEKSQRTKSDFLGPALVSDLSPYSSTSIPIDVNNLPTGYDLGTGGFDVSTAYKSGYALKVGSDYTVTAFGTLVDEEGQPIKLLTGVAHEKGQPKDHTVTVFTNRVGKFGAQGLRPGHWILEMASEPKTRFAINIPKDAVGLVKLGTLKPAGSEQ